MGFLGGVFHGLSEGGYNNSGESLGMSAVKLHQRNMDSLRRKREDAERQAQNNAAAYARQQQANLDFYNSPGQVEARRQAEIKLAEMRAQEAERERQRKAEDAQYRAEEEKRHRHDAYLRTLRHQEREFEDRAKALEIKILAAQKKEREEKNRLKYLAHLASIAGPDENEDPAIREARRAKISASLDLLCKDLIVKRNSPMNRFKRLFRRHEIVPVGKGYIMSYRIRQYLKQAINPMSWIGFKNYY